MSFFPRTGAGAEGDSHMGPVESVEPIDGNTRPEGRVTILKRARRRGNLGCWLLCAGMVLLLAGCASERQWGDTSPRSNACDVESILWGAARIAAEVFSHGG